MFLHNNLSRLLLMFSIIPDEEGGRPADKELVTERVPRIIATHPPTCIRRSHAAAAQDLSHEAPPPLPNLPRSPAPHPR